MSVLTSIVSAFAIASFIIVLRLENSSKYFKFVVGKFS